MLVVRRRFGLLARKAHIGDGCFIACLCVVPGWARHCTACGCLFHGESVCGPFSRHGGRGQVVCVGGIRRAMPLPRHRLLYSRRHRLRHHLHRRRQRMTPVGRAIEEFRMQFPRPCIAPHIRIVGIATFKDNVESSLNRIACETAPSERTRAHVGPLASPLPGNRTQEAHSRACGPTISHVNRLI